MAELQAALGRRDAAPFVSTCRDALRQKAAFPALRQCVRDLLAEVCMPDPPDTDAVAAMIYLAGQYGVPLELQMGLSSCAMLNL